MSSRGVRECARTGDVWHVPEALRRAWLSVDRPRPFRWSGRATQTRYCPTDLLPLGEAVIGTPSGSGRPLTWKPRF
jgi:hypothetical protein